MLARLRPRDRAAIVLLLLVALATSLAAAPPPATGSNAAMVIPFEKQLVGSVEDGPEGPANYYVGTTGDDGTVEMWVYGSRVVGGVQHFTATLKLSIGGKSLTAVLDGRFNSSTFRVVLNGRVTEGWLAGAQVHEESELVGFDPLTFAGTIRLMPGSAD